MWEIIIWYNLPAMVEKKIDTLFSTFGKVGNERGGNAEIIVERILTERLEKGTVPSWLTRYDRGNEVDDKHGIDGWFQTDVGRIPLQVKSSNRGKQIANQRRSSIPVIVVQVGQDDDTIYNRCISAVGTERAKYLKLRR